jgi:E3 ubiquitin-protein ligase HECTD3
LSTFKDTYLINPSCHEYEKYEFIGKLMGACLRSRESLVLYLAPYVWKKISGEVISWSRDYVSVDAAEVVFKIYNY